MMVCQSSAHIGRVSCTYDPGLNFDVAPVQMIQWEPSMIALIRGRPLAGYTKPGGGLGKSHKDLSR